MNLLRAASQKTFRRMLGNAMSSNVNIMIRGFATTAENLESEQVVEKMNRSGDCVGYNTLISDMYKAEELSSIVVEVLDRRLSPNETTYTALIDSLCKQDRIDDAYRVLNEMFVSGFSPSVDTLRDVLRGFLRIGEIRKAFEMHKEMMERPEYGSFWMDLDVDSLLTSLYQRGLSDEVTYTSLMNAYLDEGNWDYAITLYGQMRQYGSFRFSVMYFSVLINGLDKKARTTKINKYLLIFNYKTSLCRPILEYHRTLAENSSNDEFKSVVELVEGFCIKGLENVYDTLLKSNYKPHGIDDGIVYNLFIIAHCEHYNVDEAYIMYKEMVHYGFACHMFIVFALIKTLKRVNMVNELLFVIQNVLKSCNLNDSEILKFLNEFNPKKPICASEAFFDVLAEKAKDGLFLKCSYAPASA